MDIQTIPPFDIVGDATCVGPRWKRWRRSFEFYVVAKGINTDVQKKALLLHTAGMAVQDLFETLTDPGPMGDGEDAAGEYEVAMRKLDGHFSPKLNTPYERHVFRQMQQGTKETVDQFVARLRQQAGNCEFGEQLEENVRDQLIDKCVSSVFRRKLLEKGQTLTLAIAQDLGRTMETVAVQVQKMEQVPFAVNLARTQNRNSQRSHVSTQSCYRCGKQNHMAKDPHCPAKKANCRRCGLIGHFEVVCKTKLESKRPPQKHFASHSVSATKRVHCVEEEPRNDKPEYIFSLSQEEKGSVTLKVGGVEIEMMIDSGASCNVIDQITWNGMKRQHVKCECKTSTKDIYAYGSQTPLKVIGMFTAKVTLRQVTIEEDFYVIEGNGKPLLGRTTAEQLGVLRVGLGVGEIHTGQDILTEYPECFDGVGKLKSFKAKFYINEDVRPVAQPVRRIPYNLRGAVEEELEKLLKADIIEKVEGPTPWISPIIVVPKGGTNEIRVCVDMRQANEAVVRERHPIPTVDDILYHLNEGTVYSRLDLKWGFHQIELDEDSRGITTFITHTGLYRYKRLMFGISSAPELYQHIIQQVLTGCAGAHNIADDIIVHGKTPREHDERLRAVLECLKRNGLTLNRAKCQIGMHKVQFMGHVLSCHGIGPTEAKVKAVTETREPENASEVKSFLGLVNFVARYIPDLSTVSEPLRQLVKKDAQFVFGQKQKEAFAELKNRLSSAKTLAYFKQGAPTQVIADASPVGLGAVLIQKQNGVHRVVSYASKSLSAVERRYSQTEKEALALVWACERFHLYLYGKEFELVTDHKPLEVIYSARSKPSARIERWVLRLQSYNFKVKYVPGRENIADVLSRLSRGPVMDYDEGDDYIKFVAVAATPKALSTSEIERASATDKVLCAVRESLKNDTWEKGKMVEYRVISEELCVIGQILLRGTRIVMPEVLRGRTLELAHEGHPGIVQMKKRLRSKVWWPGIDKDSERHCRTCHGCQLVGMPMKPEPMTRTQLPEGPWQDLAMDYLGPLPTGEYVLVVVDYYSRYYEVDITRTATSDKVIESLKQIFATHGLPYSITSDNGPQFASNAFAEYLKENDIVHHKTTPLWPQANGEVERQNRSLLQRIKIAQGEGKNWKEELLTYLFAYRTTPHSTLGISPAEALYGRKLRTKLPELRPSVIDDESIRDEDRLKKFKGKEYADDRRRAADTEIHVGDTVLMKQPYNNKFTTRFQTKPYAVKSKTGNCVTIESPEGVQYKRNVTHIKKYETRSELPDTMTEKEREVTAGNMSKNEVTAENVSKNLSEPNNVEPNETVEPDETVEPSNTGEPNNGGDETEVAEKDPERSQRPTRNRQLPAKFKDFQLY